MPNQFFKRLLSIYGPPKTSDQQGFIAEYIKALGGFSPEVLERACNQIIRENQYKSWPTISECLKAASIAKRDGDLIEAKQAQEKRPKSKPALLDYEIRGILGRDRDMVQRACQEGWIVGLVDFVRDEHRLPYPEDRTELRQAANVVALSAAGETNLGIMHGPLVKLAQAMMARREKLIEEFAQ